MRQLICLVFKERPRETREDGKRRLSFSALMRVCLRNFSLRFKIPAPATRNKVESHKSNKRQLDTARCATIQSQIILGFIETIEN